jgi:hypothetical protein
MNHEQAVWSSWTPDSEGARGLSAAQIEQFIHDGFVKIEAAFARDLADQGRAILWGETGCDERDPTTWTKPVIRLGVYGQAPFASAANTPVLHQAFDQLVGPGRWRARESLGMFMVRFPSREDPEDTGWHIDTSFPPEDGTASDYFDWRVNVTSKGRANTHSCWFSFRYRAKARSGWRPWFLVARTGGPRFCGQRQSS